MQTKLTTFKLPEELHKKLKETAAREGRDMTEILVEKLEEYIKQHGEGNPVYKLEKWTDDPEFIAIPALMSNFETIKKWVFIQANRKNWKDLEDIKFKLQEWVGIFKEVGIRV